MAEWLEGRVRPDRVTVAHTPAGAPSGFDAMGHPVPMHRRAAGYEHMGAMGVFDTQTKWDTVNGMADALERDEPHRAMGIGMGALDLTGTYRLMSVLLTAGAESNQ